MVTQSSIIPGESHGQRSLSSCSPWGHKSWTPVSDQTKKNATTLHPTEFRVVLRILFHRSGPPVHTQLVFCVHLCVWRCVPGVSVERDALHVHPHLCHLVPLCGLPLILRSYAYDTRNFFFFNILPDTLYPTAWSLTILCKIPPMSHTIEYLSFSVSLFHLMSQLCRDAFWLTWALIERKSKMSRWKISHNLIQTAAADARSQGEIEWRCCSPCGTEQWAFLFSQSETTFLTTGQKCSQSRWHVFPWLHPFTWKHKLKGHWIIELNGCTCRRH